MIIISGLTNPVVAVYRTVDARRTPGPWVSLRQQVVAVRPRRHHRRHHRQRRRRRESGSCRTPSVTSPEMEVISHRFHCIWAIHVGHQVIN